MIMIRIRIRIRIMIMIMIIIIEEYKFHKKSVRDTYSLK